MKIIRPQNNTPTKKQLLNEMTAISQECRLYDEPQIKQSDDILVDDNTYKVKEVEPTESGVNITGTLQEFWEGKSNFYTVYDEVDKIPQDQTIENLMDEIIKQKDDKIQVTISLTKRQYDLYLKKGGEAWVKKALVGVKQGKKKKK